MVVVIGKVLSGVDGRELTVRLRSSWNSMLVEGPWRRVRGMTLMSVLDRSIIIDASRDERVGSQVPLVVGMVIGMVSGCQFLCCHETIEQINIIDE